VIVQGKPAASRGEAASDQSATAAGNAFDMGLKTVGTLDLGGSSLEVTFMPTSTALQHATGSDLATLAEILNPFTQNDAHIQVALESDGSPHAPAWEPSQTITSVLSWTVV